MDKPLIKNIFKDYFKKEGDFESKLVLLRPYNPNSEQIVCSFTCEDWNQIFPNFTENEFNSKVNSDDCVILSCIDKETQELFGFLVVEDCDWGYKSVRFHGGTWKHERRYSLLAYEGLHYVLKFLLHNEFEIFVTCNKNNSRADLLQKKFGFVEFDCNDTLSYKVLDTEKYKNNKILSQIEHCFDCLSE